MASIDQYSHRLLGFITCPSDYDIVYNNPTRDIAVYELLEDIPTDEEDFDGATGDILVGGGSGEAPAFRIKIPEALNFFLLEEIDSFDRYGELCKAFWTPTQAFTLCNGFKKMGWDVTVPIETWLAENVCIALVNETDLFKNVKKENALTTSLKWTNVKPA